MNNNKLLADKIVAARKEKGWTQLEMSQKIGKTLHQTYSARQYQKLEKGEFPKFKHEVMLAVLEILGLNKYEEKTEHEDKNELFNQPQFVYGQPPFATMSKEKIVEYFENEISKHKTVIDYLEKQRFELLIRLDTLLKDHNSSSTTTISDLLENQKDNPKKSSMKTTT